MDTSDIKLFLEKNEFINQIKQYHKKWIFIKILTFLFVMQRSYFI